MTYFTYLFSPETYERFLQSDRSVAGFRTTRGLANIKVQDKLLCYATRVSRWVAMLEVRGPSFHSDKMVFLPPRDPYVWRLPVGPLVVLPLEAGLSIKAPEIWDALSITRTFAVGSKAWGARFMTSPNRLSDEDGKVVEKALLGATLKRK